MLWTIIGFCSAYGVSSCPFCSSVLAATSMHTKPHLLNARVRGLHCVYVSLVIITITVVEKLLTLPIDIQLKAFSLLGGKSHT